MNDLDGIKQRLDALEGRCAALQVFATAALVQHDQFQDTLLMRNFQEALPAAREAFVRSYASDLAVQEFDALCQGIAGSRL